ncbi:MAG: aminotransferase class V-fold PLP-dependent enzyme [Thermoleophilaceae bacterium]|nr:aminotransferase class V-fold PLP-dependent enzyme [Thermoleophilaceae bacterium]
MPADLRSAFPVLERVAYLNTGSVGPVPTAAADAARTELDDALQNGRGGKAHFDRLIEMGDRLRVRVASLMGAAAGEIALTGATTDGVNAVVAGLDLRPGDEVLTSDEEHPGLLAPLASARERRGVKVRVAPFAELAGAVTAQTRLVACSHVGWQTGRVMDTEALSAAGAPVLLDGAQGLGAVPVDVGALGCDYYAASGQKWLCGPIGSGYLYVRSEHIDGLSPAAPGYQSLSDPLRALDLRLKDGAARFDGGFPPSHHLAWALASLDVLGDDGTVQAKAIEGARRLSGLLADRDLEVAPRGNSTLVSWAAADPEAEAARLLGAGYVVRNLPGTPYVRASVGAWSSEEEIAALASEAATSR